MPRDPLIGLVGKPSAGKSTMLNSLTDATSKVGNYPFTTIDPQRAIGYLQVDCACRGYAHLQARCRPNYGSCSNGIRNVPIELLDVAGLVPGAHLGKGLGNKFLDDLRHADALIHVVDASGTTDAEGKETRGYVPTNDIRWLRSEIVKWILGNVTTKWGSIKRRHVAIKASAVDTLQAQFSGYGSTASLVGRVLDILRPTGPLESWDDNTIEEMVSTFVDVKFPTVIALNKIDHPDSDRNMETISIEYPDAMLVPTSAVSEVFLRRLVKQRFVRYTEGADFLDTHDDLVAAGDPTGGGLKQPDDRLRERIENIRDMVLYRHGGTGVVTVLTEAARLLGLVPVFPIPNVGVLTSTAEVPTGNKAAVFRDCVLVKRGSTVGEVSRKIMGDAPIAYFETVGGVRVSADDLIVPGKTDILSFKVGRA